MIIVNTVPRKRMAVTLSLLAERDDKKVHLRKPVFVTLTIALQCVLWLVAFASGFATAAWGEQTVDYRAPLASLRTERPRLFLNSDTLPAVRQRATHELQDLLDAVKDSLEGLSALDLSVPADYGFQAAEAAFVFLCEGSADQLALAQQLLETSVAFYRQCDSENKPVSWYSFSRIHAITAYDWLYDFMPDQTRSDIGRSILEHVEAAQQPAPGRNLGDYRTGYYGEPSLIWYAGIATYGTGIDDAKSELAVLIGYDQYMKLLEHRRDLAGDDGGSSTATLGYALRANPWAEFNFFHTVRSAFGINIAQDWPYVANFPNYVLWNWLPDYHEFGTGDAFHTTNQLPDEVLYSHLAQVRHFYGRSHPEMASLAAWLQERCRVQTMVPPLTAFFLTDLESAPPAQVPPATLPMARHFEGMGQIIMRSGWGIDDTYALFTAGSRSDNHKHFDENNFIICKKGYLAIDTGTRPEPGSHLFQYFCRTVAHNCVLIRREGEVLPRYWGSLAPGEPDLPTPNDGGMCRTTGAVIQAFRTTSEFTYVASDATTCYESAKAELVTRQFLHIQPDLFVVFDRVVSTDPEYPKTWLLHTVHEPHIEGATVSAEHWWGRLQCRTLLPHPAQIQKVGGPGQEFWNDGRNWPLPTPCSIAQTELMGMWRVEVSPSIYDRETCFLHLIEVSDRASPMTVVDPHLLQDANRCGVEFSVADRTWTIWFGTQGPLSCTVHAGEGPLAISESLANTVQQQSGFGISPVTQDTPVGGLAGLGVLVLATAIGGAFALRPTGIFNARGLP